MGTQDPIVAVKKPAPNGFNTPRGPTRELGEGFWQSHEVIDKGEWLKSEEK